MGVEERPAFLFKEIRSQIHIKVGDKIRVKRLNDNGRISNTVVATVVQVYPRFTVLDFGKYRESHLLVDIYFNEKGIYGRL